MIDSSTNDLDNYGASPHIPQPMKSVKSQKRLGKASSRSSLHKRPQHSNKGSYQENIPENILKNRKKSQKNENRRLKERELSNILKEHEMKTNNSHQNIMKNKNTEECDRVDDTFSYSMEPESMANSNMHPNCI